MSKIQLSLHWKSYIIGIISSLFLFGIFSFAQNSEVPIGRFQAVTGENGHLILDTATGKYIIGFPNRWNLQQFETDLNESYRPGNN